MGIRVMQCANQRLRRYERICVPGVLPDAIITIDALLSPQSLISALPCASLGDSVKCDGSGGYACCECTCRVIILPGTYYDDALCAYTGNTESERNGRHIPSGA